MDLQFNIENMKKELDKLLEMQKEGKRVKGRIKHVKKCIKYAERIEKEELND